MVTSLCLLLLIVAVTAEDLTGQDEEIKKLFCSEDDDVVEKFKECVEKLPDEIMEAKKECATEVAPGITDMEELRTAFCDDSKGLGTKFHECLEGKKESEADLSAESKAKLTEAIQCVSDLMR